MAVERRTTKAGRVRWYARYYDPAGREHAKVFDTRRAAETFLADERAALRSATWIDPRAGQTTLDALWSRYESEQLPHRRPTTRQNYRAAWRNVSSALGNYPVGRLRHSDVQRFVTGLDKGPDTVRMAHRVLALVLDYGVANRVLAANVAKGVVLPPASTPRDRILTSTELLSLAQAVGPAGRGQVLTMGLAGLRWSEVAALKAGAVQLEARRLHVVTAATEAGGRVHLGPPKSKTSRRFVALPRLLAEDLRIRVRGRPADALVFPAPGGGVDRIGNFRRRVRWDQALSDAGLADVTPHDLRRTFGSLARSAGADLRYIQKAMGHSSITTTSRIYAHLYDTELDAVADALDKITEGSTS
ncbi:tyrosine-type recombinase/integrase [Barrientosiimonas endolithica]|uniref:Tyr recombinase domain-containing protein n=1 Tax=Barrientosiimonas endolithica TaxID=1535208 RepID=A0ABN6YKS7_9MICO|nr:site-specific integrase [Barrientosiimonas endolithica]BDZ56596.1 hypothetical protein GCM10025872_02530 [Barrientosiimonas endolithica]